VRTIAIAGERIDPAVAKAWDFAVNPITDQYGKVNSVALEVIEEYWRGERRASAAPAII